MTAPKDNPLPPRTRVAGIAAAIASVTVVGTSIGLSMPLFSILLTQRGYSSSVIGLNTMVAGVASILVTPFTPYLARRLGPGLLLLLSVIAGVAVFPLFYVFSSLTAWFVLRFVLALAINTVFVLSEFWISALAPPARRGLVMGIYATVLSVGFAVGPSILAMVGASGWPPFAVGTALMAMAIVPIVFGLGADPPITPHPDRHVLHFALVVPLSSLAALTMGAVESSVMNFAPVYGLRLGYGEEVGGASGDGGGDRQHRRPAAARPPFRSHGPPAAPGADRPRRRRAGRPGGAGLGQRPGADGDAGAVGRHLHRALSGWSHPSRRPGFRRRTGVGQRGVRRPLLDRHAGRPPG